MKRVLLILTLILPNVAHAEIALLDAVADAYANAGFPDQNFGDAGIVRVSAANDPSMGTGIKRGFIRFDLSSLPENAIVTRVVFQAFQSDSCIGDGFRVLRITSAWDEATLTWNDQPTTGLLLGQMPVVPDGNSPFESGLLTQLVQAWIDGTVANHGLAFRFHDENLEGPDCILGDTFESRTPNENVNPPQLGIRYTLPTPIMECGPGAVGAGCGATEGVLFLNGSDGGSAREFALTPSTPLSFTILEPTSRRGDAVPTNACIYAWLGEPTETDVVTVPRGLGTMCFGPEIMSTRPPKVVWNSIGEVKKLGEDTGPGNLPVIPDNGGFQFLILPAGTGRAAIATFQGLVEDDCSQGSVPFSVTNGFTVVIE